MEGVADAEALHAAEAVDEEAVLKTTVVDTAAGGGAPLRGVYRLKAEDDDDEGTVDDDETMDDNEDEVDGLTG